LLIMLSSACVAYASKESGNYLWCHWHTSELKELTTWNKRIDCNPNYVNIYRNVYCSSM
jgi:hypothetical protein